MYFLQQIPVTLLIINALYLLFSLNIKVWVNFEFFVRARARERVLQLIAFSTFIQI